MEIAPPFTDAVLPLMVANCDASGAVGRLASGSTTRRWSRVWCSTRATARSCCRCRTTTSCACGSWTMARSRRAPPTFTPRIWSVQRED
eukprot:531342-Rhodomonas_salina.1